MDAAGAASELEMQAALVSPGGVAPTWEEDWMRFGSRAALLQAAGGDDPDFLGPELAYEPPRSDITLDEAVGDPLAGTDRTVRYDYLHPTGGSSLVATIAMDPVAVFPTQEMWGEAHVRWSPDFNTTSPDEADWPGDHKLIMGQTTAAENGRWMIYVGADGPPHSVQVERPFPDWGADWLNIGGEPTASDLWDGASHVIRWHWRESTTATSDDGESRLWIDGTLWDVRTGFSTSDLDGVTPSRISALHLGRNKDDGQPGVVMSLWWGRVRIWLSDPGWAA